MNHFDIDQGKGQLKSCMSQLTLSPFTKARLDTRLCW